MIPFSFHKYFISALAHNPFGLFGLTVQLGMPTFLI